MASSLLRNIQRAGLRTLCGKVAAALALAIFANTPALAGEAEIRKALAERLADLGKIDEVTKSPIPGLRWLRLRR